MRHIISILVENEAGALSRISNMFSARGYNIESLTVAPTEDPSLSRMTIETNGSDDVIEQIVSVGKVETQARLEGRSMTMVLVPDKKPVKKEKSVVAESPATEAEVLPTETPVETPVIETTAPATDTPKNSEE